MIQLYTFPPAFGLRNVSPFCLKVEMALAQLGIEHEIVLEADPRKGPKAKLPFIVDGDLVLADSELILLHLDERSGGRLYGDLSDAERARGLAFTRLIEDHLYWMVVASRWLDEQWFPNIRKGFFGGIPAPLRGLVSSIARSQVRKTYNLHGLGRHSLQEQARFCHSDLQALDAALTEMPYIAGQRLTVYDYAVASLLAGALDNRPATWVTELMQGYPRLVEYAERVQSETGVYCREL